MLTCHSDSDLLVISDMIETMASHSNRRKAAKDLRVVENNLRQRLASESRDGDERHWDEMQRLCVTATQARMAADEDAGLHGEMPTGGVSMEEEDEEEVPHSTGLSEKVKVFDRAEILTVDGKKSPAWVVEVNDKKPGDLDIGVFLDEAIHDKQWIEVHPNEITILDEKISGEKKEELEKEIEKKKKSEKDYRDDFKDEVKEGKDKKDKDNAVVEGGDDKKASLKRTADTNINIDEVNLVGEKSELTIKDTDETKKFKIKDKGVSSPEETEEIAGDFFMDEDPGVNV